MTRRDEHPTMILPQVAPEAGGTGLWRARLLLLGGLTAVIAVLVAVALSVRSPGEQPVAAAPPATAEAAPDPVDEPPAVTVETVTTTSAVPFPTRTVKAKALPKGGRAVRVRGVAGERRDTYEVTYRDGAVVRRTLVSSVVVRPPVTQVVAVGRGKTKPRR